jgi:hypothetical protein
MVSFDEDFSDNFQLRIKTQENRDIREIEISKLHCITYMHQWFLAPAKTLHVSTTAPHDANTDISSKEGAVIVSMRNAHRGQHWLHAQE